MEVVPILGAGEAESTAFVQRAGSAVAALGYDSDAGGAARSKVMLRRGHQLAPETAALGIFGDSEQTDGFVFAGFVAVRKSFVNRYKHGIGPALATAADPGSVQLVAAGPVEKGVGIETAVAMALAGDVFEHGQVGGREGPDRGCWGRHRVRLPRERDTLIDHAEPRGCFGGLRTKEVQARHLILAAPLVALGGHFRGKSFGVQTSDAHAKETGIPCKTFDHGLSGISHRWPASPRSWVVPCCVR